jgi:hypothetical protein
MTLQHAIKRVMNGDMLFVHTPAPPHEKFYFFASDFTTVPLPIGRRLRRLKGMVMLIKETPDHPDAPYFYWKLGSHVNRDEALACASLFCEQGLFADAQALKEQLPQHFS